MRKKGKKPKKRKKREAIPQITLPQTRQATPPVPSTDPWMFARVSAATSTTGATLEVSDALRSLRAIPPRQREAAGLQTIYTELRTIHQLLGRYVGKAERVMGQLAPKAVAEYYDEQSYAVKETEPDVDKKYKIDLIATKGNEARGIQVKKGPASLREIRQTHRKGSEYLKRAYKGYGQKIIEIVASRVPREWLKYRDKVRKQRARPDLVCTHWYVITEKLPQYRYAY